MNRFFILSCLLFAFLLFCFSYGPVAYAHMLKVDDTIGAVIHVDPDDDPYVGQPTDIFFDLKDTTGRFRPENCNCTVSIKRGDDILTTFSLYGSGHGTMQDFEHSVATYTFPSKGIYTIQLDGSPVTGGTFQTFSVSYDIRVSRAVERETQTSNSTSLYIFVTCSSLIICAVSVRTIFLSRKRKKGTHEQNPS